MTDWGPVRAYPEVLPLLRWHVPDLSREGEQ